MSDKALPPVPMMATEPGMGRLREDAETSSSDTARELTGADSSRLIDQSIEQAEASASGGKEDSLAQEGEASEAKASPNASGPMPMPPPPRRPLVFHRSLTSPSPSSKLGALRHPAKPLNSDGIVTIDEGRGKGPFSQPIPAGVERRNTEPDGAGLVAADPSKDANPSLSAIRSEDESNQSLELSSPDWSNMPQEAGEGEKGDLVTHKIPGITGLGTPVSQPDDDSRNEPSPKRLDSEIVTSPTSTRQRSTSLNANAGTAVDSVFADTLQLPISTLLQLIPPHLLDPSHERLSASSLQVPVTSIQALLESCRTLNWLCTNFGAAKEQEKKAEHKQTDPSDASLLHGGRDFDVSELVQRTCDVVSGQAAEKDIDIVLLQDIETSVNHDDKGKTGLGAKYLVNGDEDTLRFVLLKTLAHAAEVAPPRSIIETSLQVNSASEASGMIGCTLDVLLLRPNGETSSQPLTQDDGESSQIAVITPFVKVLGGDIQSLVGTEKANPSNASYSVHMHQRLHVPLRQAQAPAISPNLNQEELQARQRFLPALRLAEEPEWDELSNFVTKTLSGCRIALHGDPATSFVRHLTSFFASCGCELAILSTEDRTFGDSATWAATPASEKSKEVHERQMSTRTAVALTGNRPSLVSYPSGVGMGDEVAGSLGNTGDASMGSALLDPVTGVPVSIGPLSKQPSSDGKTFTPFSFVLIDDDLDVLQHELLRIRAAVSTLRSALSAHTPGLDPHRPQSPTTHAIIFFFSLLNYRPVRDAIQALVETSEQSGAPLPEILMVPKPCGSRRLLTALHTAWEKPLVDPFFSPIATSPMCPTSRGIHKDAWGSITMPKPAQPSRIPTTTAPRADEFNTPMRRENRMSTMHIDIPPRPAFKKKVSKEQVAKEDAPEETKRVAPTATESAGGVIANQASHGSVAQSLLSVQQEIASPRQPPEEIVVRPGLNERRKTTSSKKSQNLQTPHTTSNPSSHAASSPMMTDALEYFSETAAKISEDGAAGFMIQSPDGRPAGIFFQPRTRAGTSSRASTASRRTAHAHRSSADASADMMRIRHASEGSAVDRANMPLISLREIVDHGKTADEPTSASMQRDTTISTSKGEDAGRNGDTKNLTPPSSAPAGQAHVTVLPLESSAPQGMMYTPQVGIQSILAAELPSSKAASTKNKDTHAVEPPPGSNGTAEQEPTSQPGKVENTQAPDTLPARLAAEDATKGQQSVPESPLNGRTQFGQAGVHPRPSAQPQSGVLIGAGFQPAKKRMSALNVKKAAKDIEVLPPIKVLIVDDNPINVKILSTWLEKRKIKIGVARDGQQAVHEWQTGGYQLILMDIQLPVMDGIEATKVIRRLEREASIDSASSPSVASAAANVVKELGATTPAITEGQDRAAPGASGDAISPQSMLSSTLRSSVIIVALTASVLNSDRVAALAAGCNDFLNKPVNMRWLERKVTEWGSMQYLIGFRSLNGMDDGPRGNRPGRKQRGGPHSREGSLLHPADALGASGSYSNDVSMVKRAFGHAPEKLARDVADRLHIGEPGRRQKVQ